MFCVVVGGTDIVVGVGALQAWVLVYMYWYGVTDQVDVCRHNILTILPEVTRPHCSLIVVAADAAQNSGH